ncbi:MAG: dTDP-4-dehydrorhamnose 3,5-epimerase [Pontiellaceae bacterium]|nr:dTDP-4-dehydrorhamnose 3,5-epimerase [Pontiellaceae bacterium]MBN2785142.1 dTDP-4-dehydrorhamnose 3,5-epimerase [Pontiellaceae bacterium]
MKFEPTPLKDAWIITQTPIGDERGYFARAFCQKEFETHGIPSSFVQGNTSFSRDVGTLRGLHWQVDPAPETKLMRCVRGAIYDLIVDMRPESPTYLRHFGIELTPDNHRMLFVPARFAHGFLTLEPDSQAYYLVGGFYTPECERGVRFDDPKLAIEWPTEPQVVSDKDRSWPLL